MRKLMTHYRQGLDHSTTSSPRPLHPTRPHVILSLSLSPLLSSPQPIQRDPNTSLSIRAYYRAPVLARQRKKAFAAQECVQRYCESWMRSLKVVLSHPCPYPLCQSAKPPRRNMQPPKRLGEENKSRKGFLVTPFPFYFSIKLYHN